MAFSSSILQRGNCGNFHFKLFDITDAQSTKSVVKTGMRNCKFISSTNTSDNADHMNGQVLSWTGTCDTDVANELKDTSEAFVTQTNGLIVYNTMTGDSQKGKGAIMVRKDADEQYLFSQSNGAAKDLFPDGNETYRFDHQGYVLLTPVTSDDDGTLFVLGN